jgi:hypothetical protein
MAQLSTMDRHIQQSSKILVFPMTEICRLEEKCNVMHERDISVIKELLNILCHGVVSVINNHIINERQMLLNRPIMVSVFHYKFSSLEAFSRWSALQFHPSNNFDDDSIPNLEVFLFFIIRLIVFMVIAGALIVVVVLMVNKDCCYFDFKLLKFCSILKAS